MKRISLVWLMAILAISASIVPVSPARAARPGQGLQTTYTWWLARWDDGALLCAIDVTHEGLPTADEIEAACGRDLRVQWENTPPCPDGSNAACTGLHLTLASTRDTPTPLSTGLETATVTQTPTATLEYPATSTVEAAPTAPPLRKVPWLSRPSSADDLSTNQSLSFLAGRLIANGIADAGDCPSGGLMENGAANTCGLEKAHYQVYLWQNRFNTQIFDAAMDVGVPAYLLKGVFTEETQFWPATTRNNAWDFGEYGLGQLNELGTDALLAWNSAFYTDLCRSVLDPKNCKKEYISQPAKERALLRGSVINLVQADCPTCSYGIDLPKTEASVRVFAETLNANNAQVKQVIRNATGWYTLMGVSRDDLWRFTLVNYHAGPGCLYSALGAARLAGEKLTWDNVSERLEPGCKRAVGYVEAISEVYVSDPPPAPATPTLLPTETQIPTETATATLPVIETVTLPVSETPIATEAGSTPTAALSPETVTATETFTQTEFPPDTVTPTATIPSTPTPTTLVETVTPTSEPTATVTPIPTAIDVQSPHEAGEIIVQMESGSRSDIEAMIESLPVPAEVKSDQSLAELNAIVLEVAPSDLSQALAELQDHPDVASAEPNYLAQAAFITNDPGFAQQGYLSIIQVPMTWDLITSSQEVIVAVIDTGVDTSHPDLASQLWQNAAEANGLSGLDDDNNGYVDDVRGWNMVAGNNNVNDDHGHGTHVAGIIGAIGDNRMGVAGIAPNARILTVKALDAQGFGSYAQIADAIVYATDQGARVINLGFGGAGHSQALQDAVNYALGRGVIVVAAAGNTGGDAPVYPAAYPGVISVSAVDNGLTWGVFSSFGNNTTLSAPGIDIYSTYPGGGYSQMSGTSMASAEVSGIAALLAGQSQFTNPVYIRDALVNTAYDLGAPGQDPFYGFGLVRALDSLQYSAEGMPPVIWPTPGPLPTPVTNGGVWAMASQDLWGTTQTCSYAFTNAANSIDLAFNDALASCSGGFGNGGEWTYTAVQDTALTSVVSATLEYRFYITGWVNDTIALEVTYNNWTSYSTIATFQTGSPPPSALTTLSYNVSAIFNTQARVRDARFRLRGTQVNGGTETITVFLDEARLIVSDTLPTPTPLAPQPTPTLSARALTAVPGAADPHVDYTATSDDCAGCHRSHTSAGIVLRSTWPEENICFTCHKAGGTGTNIQPAFTLYTNTATRFLKHDIAGSNGVHRVGQNTGASFGGANRHIECEDCHEPHEATRDAVSNTTLPPMIQPEMFSTSGVNPTWSGPGAPSGFAWLPQAQREYQVCLKCHSSFTTLPTYQPDGWGWTGAAWNYVANGLPKLTTTNISQVLDSRDMAQEFNPNNASFHPVIAGGRNTAIPAAAFVNGWSANSMLYCADCHTNANQPTNGYGPHGSPRLHLLDGAMNYTTVDNTNNRNYQGNGELCFKCHAYGLYVNGTVAAANTGFRDAGNNLHAYHSGGDGSFGVPCYECHDTHGSEQQHLINFNSAAITFPSGYDSQSAWVYNSTTGVGSCYLSCHSVDHASPGSPNNKSYDNIP